MTFTFLTLLRLIALWTVSITGYVLCLLARTIHDLGLPFQCGSELMLKLGEKIIAQDKYLQKVKDDVEKMN